MTSLSSFLARLVFSMTLLVAQNAAAQQRADDVPAENVRAAETLFDDAKKLMAEGRYAEACIQFESSQRLDPATGTMLNLAYCWKQIGKTASAWATYREAASLAHRQRHEQREEFARAEAAELESKLSRLSLHVTDADNPALELRRNGDSVPRDAWSVPTPLDPGEYRIEAVAPDRRPFSTTVRVGDPGRTVELVIPPLEPMKSGKPANTATESAAGATERPRERPNRSNAIVLDPAPPTHASFPTLSIALGAAGLVALGTAGLFALNLRSENAAAKAICADPEGPCSASDVSRHANHVQSAKNSRTGAFIGAGVAGVLLGASAVLYFEGTSSPRSSLIAPRSALRVLGSAGGGLVVLTQETW